MWAEAYLEQARCDWATYELIEHNSGAPCQRLHYLQMTTEKLGKALLLRSGSVPLHKVTKSHQAFTAFLRLAARNPALTAELRMTATQLQQYVKGTLPMAHEIECLAPALAGGGPNAEYPWEAPSRAVIAPVCHTYAITADLSGPKGRNLLKLLKIVLVSFDHLF